MKLRVVSFILLIFLSATIIEVPALAALSINDESVFTKQQTSIECPLGSTVSMLRRRAIIDDKENWSTTYSYAKIKAIAWTKCMETSFSFPSANGYKVYSYSMDLELDLHMGDIDGKKQYFINELKKHPEGIAAYVFFLGKPKREGHLKSKSGKSEQHVVLITDYDEKTDKFYCFDPAGYMPSGRIELADSSLSKYIKNAGYWNDSESIQNNILGYIAQIWMITNVSGGGSNITAPQNEHGTHTYNDKGYCTIGGEEYPIALQPITATTYQAINDNTPIRWRPYQPEPIIDRLSKDTAVTVVASGENAKGNLWYKLDNGTWVYSENVKKSGKPSAPTGISITKASTTTAKISWNAAGGATSYKMRYNSPTSNGWKVDPDYREKKLTSYTTTGLGAKTYQFQVCAVNSAGESGWTTVTYAGSNSSSTTVAKPNIPTGLSVTRVSDTTAIVSWNAVSGALSYKIEYMSPTSGGWQTDQDYKTKTSTSYISTNLGTKTYQYRVCAINSAGASGWTEVEYTHTPTTTMPPQPEFAVSSTNEGSYTVTVPANYILDCYQTSTATTRYTYISAKAASYNIHCTKRLNMSDGTTRYFFVSGDSKECYFVYIGAMNVTDSSTTLTQPEKGTATIKYHVNGGSGAPASHSVPKDSNGVIRFNLSSTKPTRSGYTFLGWRLENSTAYGIDAPGQSIAISTGSASSNDTLTYYAQWKSSSTKPAAPTNFKVKWKSAGTATVSWSSVTGATSYEVEFWSRSWSEWRADYEYSSYLGTQATSYTTSGLNNHSSYEFRVRAKNANGRSDWTYFTYYK